MGLISEIINHRTTEDTIPSDQLRTEVNVITKHVITTKGLDIQVESTDGTWGSLSLKDVKVTYPLKLAEYAVVRKFRMNQYLLGGSRTPFVRGKA